MLHTHWSTHLMDVGRGFIDDDDDVDIYDDYDYDNLGHDNDDDDALC